MKSYSNLFEKFISDQNIELAIHSAFKGKKKKRRDVKAALSDLPVFKAEIKHYAENFHSAHHAPREIYDGISRKKRIIIVPTLREQVIHHMLCNVLVPIILPSMYEHSYASLPGRGASLGKKVIEKHIKRKHPRYYLKMDIRKFFNSIPHEVLKVKLSRIIRDERYLDILFDVIDVVPVGIPIGFYTSQWLANFYLTDFDHWIKQELKASAYYRYMDDMVIFSNNKRALHKMRESIDRYLQESLGLRLKSNWQVVRFSYMDRNGREAGRDLDFMGFRFYCNRTTIRKSILKKARRKALNMRKGYTIYSCRQMLSYIGYFKKTNTYGFWKRYIAPHIDLPDLKRRISAYDRRVNIGKNLV